MGQIMILRTAGLVIAVALIVAPHLRAQPKKVEVRSRVAGIVKSIHVRAGDTVKKGDVIVQLDSRPQTAAFEVSKAQLAVAEAAVQLADANFQRAERLQKQNVISREEVEAAALKLQIARAKKEEQRAVQIRDAALLDAMQIRAPFDGKVERPLVNVGDMVKANESVAIVITRAQPQKTPDDVRKLQAERLTALGELAELTAREYQKGSKNVAWKSVLQTRRDLADAELELSETPAQRLDILRKLVAATTDMKKQAEARFQAARGSEADVVEAQIILLEARIRLAREEANSKN
jgi:multidrug efflux pump subunit AcrA (membrane-fusion protein)